MSKFCAWWHFKILNDPHCTWSQVWKRNGRTKFLVLVVKTLFTTHSTPNCTAIIWTPNISIWMKTTFVGSPREALSIDIFFVQFQILGF
jgi:late competence protein required for DNA uptake (superfamily II DNA/RNA helicase)